MRVFAFAPLWASQISIQTMAISNLKNTLIICGLYMKHILLKTCIDQIMFSTIPELIGVPVVLSIYKMSRIFK